MNLRSLSKFDKFSQKLYNVFITMPKLSFIFFYSKVLIDDKDSKNRVQIVVKLSMKLDPKTLINSKNSLGCKLAETLLR